MKKTEEIIEKIIKEYPWHGGKELFKAELERLALLANREGFAEATDIAINGKTVNIGIADETLDREKLPPEEEQNG